MREHQPQPEQYPGFIGLTSDDPLADQLIAWRQAALCCMMNPTAHVFFAGDRAYISRKLYGLSFLR